jgi:hypothetical protein
VANGEVCNEANGMAGELALLPSQVHCWHQGAGQPGLDYSQPILAPSAPSSYPSEIWVVSTNKAQWLNSLPLLSLFFLIFKKPHISSLEHLFSKRLILLESPCNSPCCAKVLENPDI